MNNKSKHRIPKTNDELRQASDVLIYEIKMFHQTTVLMLHGQVRKNLILNNCVVESFVIHGRVLYEFLYKNETDHPDILAKHFFDGNLNNIIQDKTQQLKDLWDRAGKELAHISYKRLDTKETHASWDFMKIFFELSERLIQFYEKVNKDKLSKYFQDEFETFKIQVSILNQIDIFSDSPQKFLIRMEADNYYYVYLQES